MKVLLIHQAFVSKQEAGGTRHLEFGQRLAAGGDSLIVVASQISYLPGTPVHAGRGGVYYREEVDGITVYRAYTPAVLHRSFAWRLVAFLVFSTTSIIAALRAGPVDLVMGTTPSVFQALAAWLVARLRRTPFVLEVRDLWPEFAIDMGILRNPVLQTLARIIERSLYRGADHIVVNSPAYRDYLLSHGVPATQISVVPNGVDVEMFDPAATGEGVRQRYQTNDKYLIVYAGAHGMANDLETVIRAAELLRQQHHIHFLLAGDGKERRNLERLATQLGLGNVTFAGALPKSEMPALLAAADICIATLMNIPMFRTTYPNKVFDYMAAGRPSILGIDGVIREVIEACGGGVAVPPGNAIALAAAIEQFCADPVRRADMGQRARQYVAAHFDRRQQAEEFRQVMRRILVPRGPNAPPT